MRPVYTAVECHPVNIIAPVDVNGGVNSDVFSMQGYSHVSIGLFQGVSAGTLDVTLEECDDFVPTNTTAIAFDVYKEETAAGDTLGAKVAATSSGITTSSNNSIMYWIEVDAAQLTDGFPNLRLVIADPSASVIASAVAILSGGLGKEQSATRIA